MIGHIGIAMCKFFSLFCLLFENSLIPSDELTKWGWACPMFNDLKVHLTFSLYGIVPVARFFLDFLPFKLRWSHFEFGQYWTVNFYSENTHAPTHTPIKQVKLKLDFGYFLRQAHWFFICI